MLELAEMEKMVIKDASELQLQAKPEPVHHTEKLQALQTEHAQKISLQTRVDLRRFGVGGVERVIA